MVQILPGAETTIAPHLVSLVDALGKALDPNFEKREQYQNALMMNPQLLQSVADAYRNNPQLLQQMGLSGGMGKSGAAIEGMVSGTPQSLESITDNATRTEVQNNPDAIRTIVSRRVHGKTPKELESEQLDLDRKKKTAQELDSIYRNSPDLVDIDIDAVARGVAYGKPESGKVKRLLASPVAAPYYMQRVNDFHNERARDEEKAERKLERDQRSTAMDRQERAQAFSLYRDSGGMGTPQIHRDLLYDGATQDRMQGLVSGTITPENERDNALLAIGSKFKQDQKLHSIYQKNKVRSALAKKRIEMLKATEDDQARPNLINEYNDLANEATLMGISAPRASYNTRGVFLPARIEFKVGDRVFDNGEKAEEAAFNTDSGSIDLPFIEKVEQAEAIMRGLPAEQHEEAFKNMEAADPRVAAIVRRRLKDRPVGQKPKDNKRRDGSGFAYEPDSGFTTIPVKNK